MSISYGLNLGIMNGAADGDLYGNAMRAFQRACDAFLQPIVKGYLTNTPPGSPVDGDMYIVGSAPTGSWASYAGYVAKWSALLAAWEFYLPKNGWQFQSNRAREIYRYTGGAWEIFYQEGTFTPTLYGSTTEGTNTYSLRAGNYIKNGMSCFISINITLTAKDAAMAGNARVSGIPFNQDTTTYQAINISSWTGVTLDPGRTTVGVSTAGSYLFFSESGSAVSLASLDVTAFSPTAAFRIAGTFKIA